MSKKTLPLVLSFLAIASSIAGCGRKEDSSSVSIDNEKTQLYVKYHNGGLRREWIDKVCDQFEEDYADYSFEEGKKGIQIQKDFEKNSIQVDAVTSSKYQVFLMENTNYYQFVAKNTMLDITDVVKGNAPIDATANESKTIESKMFDDSKSFYNLGENGQDKYYALPFFETSCLLNYNVDLFDQRCYYFAKDKTAEGFSESELNSNTKVSELFITDLSEPRSLGPDGKTGIIDGYDYSLDDGLPATYADFHALMTYMANDGVTPISWNGYEKGYLTSFALNLYANAAGYDQMKNILTFDGTANNILDIDSSFRPKKDSDGNYIYADDIQINGTSVAKTHQQKGLLDSCNLVSTIMNNDSYFLQKGFANGFMHTDAQNYFINGMEDQTLVDKPIGMLVEGAWWNSEATPSYKSNEDKMSKKFGILPNPKPTASQIGEGNVTVSERDSTMFINANCPENMIKAAKTFLAYINSDKSMNTFTRYTDAVRMMNYELSDETLSQITEYGKRAYAFYRAPTTKHLDWRPQSQAASAKTSALSYRKWGFSTSANDDNPFIYFYNNKGKSGEDLFAAINQYYSNWSN